MKVGSEQNNMKKEKTFWNRKQKKRITNKVFMTNEKIINGTYTLANIKKAKNILLYKLITFNNKIGINVHGNVL